MTARFRDDGPAQTPRTTLLRNSLLVSALIFTLLEIWRPCFFLTDDNLSGGFPLFTDMGHRLWHGQSPFVSDYLFGGNYNMLRDATFFCWHPVYLLSSLLAETPAHFLIMEAPAFFFLMLATAGFVNLAHFLRGELSLKLSDGWLMFYTMSFTYTFMALTTGSSWLSFLGNHSALPWLALGILQKDLRRGLGLVSLFSLHHILGGHLAPLISGSLFLSLFAVGIACWRRSAVPLLSWFLGYGVAVLVILPLLLPAMEGFMSSHRAEGLSVEAMRGARIPLLYFPGSYFLGTSYWLVKHPPDFHVYHPVLAACAAAWCIIPALASRAKWHFLESFCLGLVILIMVFIIRPVWVTEIMNRLPLLRSLRWPFRELLDFHFFLHLFFILRFPAFTPVIRRVIAGWSLAIFLIPMVIYPPPSLNPMRQQRQLVFSGEMDRYWDQVKLHLKPTDRIAVVVPGDYVQYFGEWAPFSLLGTHNFCCLAKVISASGYSLTVPANQLYLQTPSISVFGFFLPSQMDDLWRERPDLKLIVMEGKNPVRIMLRSKDGSAVDLTPYVPKDGEFSDGP